MELTTADLVQIQQLAARYNHALDTADGDAWAATFTSDGTFTDADGTHRGPVELAAFARRFAERLRGATHWINEVVIEGRGDEATMRSCFHLSGVRDGETEAVISARYEDRLRRIDGEWRFASRTVLPA